MSVHGQDNHYWSNQFGARSALLGGALTAEGGDNSAIFYNPGGLAFVKNSSVSLVGNMFRADLLKVENGAGSNLDLKHKALDAIPSFANGVIKIKKLPVALTYGILNRTKTKMNMTQLFTADTTHYSWLNSNQYYRGRFEYDRDMREDWLGFGAGVELFENFGLGISNYVVALSHDYSYLGSSEVLTGNENNDYLSNDVLNSYKLNVKHRTLGYLLKLGLNYHFDKMKFGLTVTAPTINIKGIANSTIERNIIINQNTFLDNNNLYARQSGVRSTYKTPLILDIGGEWYSKWGIFMARLAWFSPIKKHNTLDIKLNEDDPALYAVNDPINFLTTVSASKQVVNFAIGADRKISEKFSLLLGFRTNFNYFKYDALEEGELTITNDYWNIFHYSMGASWKQPKYIFTVGLDYARGRSKNDQQYINLTEASPDSLYFGTPNTNTHTTYDGISLILGFTFLYGR